MPDSSLITQMRQHYLAESSKKIEHLGHLLDEWVRVPANPDAFHSFERAIHNLVGSGESYGCPRISEAARLYESFLDWFTAQKLELTPQRVGVMRQAIGEIAAIFRGEQSGVPVEIPSCRILTIFKQSRR